MGRQVALRYSWLRASRLMPWCPQRGIRLPRGPYRRARHRPAIASCATTVARLAAWKVLHQSIHDHWSSWCSPFATYLVTITTVEVRLGSSHTPSRVPAETREKVEHQIVATEIPVASGDVETEGSRSGHRLGVRLELGGAAGARLLVRALFRVSGDRKVDVEDHSDDPDREARSGSESVPGERRGTEFVAKDDHGRAEECRNRV